MATNTIENARKHKKKWTRWDTRGILTPIERRKLKDGTWKYDRHLKFRVKLKTTKALFALPLILSRLEPEDFLSEAISSRNAVEIVQGWLKNLVFYYYKLEEHRIMDERAKKKRKLKVAFREAWKPVNKTIREAKAEIQKGKSN